MTIQKDLQNKSDRYSPKFISGCIDIILKEWLYYKNKIKYKNSKYI